MVDDEARVSYGPARRCAAMALGMIADTRAVEPLERLVSSRDLRARCEALSQRNPALRSSLARAEDLWIVEAGVEALGALHTPTSHTALVAALGLTAFPDGVYSADLCQRLRSAIVAALGRHGDTRWNGVSRWADVYKVSVPVVLDALLRALHETGHVDPFQGWERQSEWALTVAEIANRVAAIGDPRGLEPLSTALSHVRNWGAMLRLSDTSARDYAVRSLTDAVQSLQTTVEGRGIGLLIVIVAGIEQATPEFIKAAATEAGFGKGPVKTVKGPTTISRGQAEALLARFELEDSAGYLGRPFSVGGGMIANVRFAYIKVEA